MHGVPRWAANAARRRRAELIPAATVIPVRDGPDGIETLMLRRNSKLEFAGGMWVFPGGRVDPDDHQADDADELAPRGARRGARSAARRPTSSSTSRRSWSFSHWAPPAIAPKRFATWFFLAPAPEGDDHHRRRRDPRPRLVPPRRRPGARATRCEIELAPPTWITLYELSRFAEVDEALAAMRDARARALHHPGRRWSTGGVVALWHGDVGYDDQDADARRRPPPPLDGRRRLALRAQHLARPGIHPVPDPKRVS